MNTHIETLIPRARAGYGWFLRGASAHKPALFGPNPTSGWRDSGKMRGSTRARYGEQPTALPSHSWHLPPKLLVILVGWAWLLTGDTLRAADAWIWWEGEKPASSNIPATTWLSPSTQAERNALSGANILTAVNIKSSGPYWANYKLNVAQAGTYRFYARKIWQYGPFTWGFDGAAPTYASSQLQLMDNADYEQYFGLNWVYLGDVTLTTGAHTFRVELNFADWGNEPSNIKGADLAGFDAFILSTQPFIPRAKLQPNQRYNLTEPGKWNFESLADDFSSTALLDLRSLNETVAGQSGFVHVAAGHSGKFVLGDGTPVRFWGVNVGNEASDFASLSLQANFLAKRGVNLVRYFHQLPTSNPTNINAVDPAYIEGAQRTVAAFKQQGIYTEIGLFWELPFTIRKGWGIDGYTNDVTGPSEVLMFDDQLKAAYKEWARQLFTATNAYTGLTLAQDPAVAIIEIQNEDSLLSWGLDTTALPQAQREKLEAKFGAFLMGKYGGLAAAQTAWGNATIPNQSDDPANGRMAVAVPWYMTADDSDSWFLALTLRMADQIQFLTELQRAFFQEMRDYYRNSLGCQSLIESGNWITADERFLTDAERYSYTVNEVIDRHPYFNPNPGNGSSYAVNVGDYYKSIAGVSNPRSLPVLYKQVVGFPHNASESTWVNPNRFKAEGPLLVAAYNSMADVNSWVWFATSSLAYEDILNKFQVAVPSLMGQFPGAALLYRRGDVAEAAVAVREERNLSNIYHKELALISEFDPSRNPPDDPVYNHLTGTGRLDPLAMLVGKVECDYVTNGTATNYVSPILFTQLDMTNQIVESLPAPDGLHGQLNLDWGKGLFRVNTPRSQGATGFLNSVGQVDLDDVTITSTNSFGAILVIALDDLPIAQSQKILIQAMTEENPYLWQEQDQIFTNNNVVYAGKKILSMGQPPMNVVDIMGTVTLKGFGPNTKAVVRVLDENGYDRGAGESQVSGADLRVTLPTDSLYTVVMMAPSIVSQPQGQTVIEGGSASFTVGASGLGPLSYQWLLNANPVAGKTNATLSLTKLVASQAGIYSVMVTNIAGSTTSAPAWLVVNTPASITAEPASQTLVVGSNAVFDLTVTGTSPLTYQWQLNGANLADGGHITGSQSNLLTVTSVVASDAGRYQAVVTNAYGSATSVVAILVVLPATPLLSWANPIAITYGTALGANQLDATASVPGSFAYSPAANTLLGAGTNSISTLFTPNDQADYNNAAASVSLVVLPAPLSVTASNATRLYGTANPVLTGALAGLVNGDNVSVTYATPATASSPVGIYPIASSLVDPDHRLGNYALAVSNGSLTVTPAPLTVQAADATRVYGQTNPAFTGAITGSVIGDNVTATYSCAATATSLPGTYPIVPALTDPDHRLSNYQITLANGTLTVTPAAPPTILSVTPDTGLTNGGATVTLLGTAFQSGATVTFGTLAAGSVTIVNSSNLTAITPPSGLGPVDVVVTNADGQSATFTNGFTFVAPPGVAPLVVSQSTNQLSGLGQAVEFAVTATGTEPLDWQWEFNGTNLVDNGRITGSQSNLLSIASVVVSDAGSYQAVVTNAYGSATSVVAILVVLPATPLLTWTEPSAITYGSLLGSNQLNATASVPGSFAYQPAANTMLSAGTNSLLALFTPDDPVGYMNATANVSLVVLPAPLSLVASNVTRLYGTANPILRGALVGLVNADNVTATFSTPAMADSAVGTYAILPTFVDPDNRLGNYLLTAQNGILSITPAPLTVQAADATRIYGQTNPVFTGTITGLVNSDNFTATYSSAATVTSLPGKYAIVPALSDPDNRRGNYQVTLSEGTLRVIPAAPPTILSIAPDTGLTNGGTSVTLLGTGFQSGATVTFDTLAAGSVTIINSSNLTAITPPSGLGSVDVVVTNADGQSATFTNGFTFVAPPGVAPVIVAQPTNQVVGLGLAVQFTVTATGTEPLDWQWEFNGTNLVDIDRIAGTQSNLLTLTTTSLTDAGRYRVVVTNAYGSTTSDVATLVIIAQPVFQAATLAEGTITLSWSATTGEKYGVDYKSDLSEPTWTNLAMVTATNSTATVSDAMNRSPQRFYRTVWVP